MQLEQRTIGNVGIVKVTGEITLKKNRDAALHDQVRTLLHQGCTNVLVDLAGVSYIDSAGLGELVQSHSTVKNHGGSLRLLNPTGRLRELLVLTRLTSVLRSYDDEVQALESFGAQAS